MDDRVIFELVDYRDLAKRGERFDRIVSVGMFEHVGRPQFETFFRACASLLADDGVMLVHTIGRFGGPGTTGLRFQVHLPRRLHPRPVGTLARERDIPLIHSDIDAAATMPDPARMVRREANRAAIVDLYDERFYRMWTFYLAGATAAFEWGGMGNYQIQYVRDRRALPITRDYMAATEKRLLGGA